MTRRSQFVPGTPLDHPDALAEEAYYVGHTVLLPQWWEMQLDRGVTSATGHWGDGDWDLPDDEHTRRERLDEVEVTIVEEAADALATLKRVRGVLGISTSERSVLHDELISRWERDARQGVHSGEA